MRRVVFALLGEAALFAALIAWLGVDRALGGAGQGAMGVFVGVLAVGFPALYYCCKNRLWDLWRAILLSAMCGAICALPFVGGNFNPLFLIFFCAVCGAGFGVIFWIAAIWRNDNLTCPKSFCLPCGAIYKVARNTLARPLDKYR